MTATVIEPGLRCDDRAAAQRRELARFLRAARERVKPSDLGLAVGARRRAPGLLREEVAQLASISCSWYSWLEQGRRMQVSEQVLGSVADALRLSSAERDHLFLLAGHAAPGTDDRHDSDADRGLRRMLHQLLVLIEFEDEAEFHAWWDSVEYAEVKPLRERSTTTTFAVLFPGEVRIGVA